MKRAWLSAVIVALLAAGIAAAADAPAANTPAPPDPADAVLADMQKQLGAGFHYAKVKCFVVAGDSPKARFDAYCRHTIEAGYNAYQKMFFDKAPTGVLRVYLFRDKKSYETNVKRIFGTSPSTPFGYFSYTHQALVMNIGTGGGTLVHEMFHALVQADFPNIPTWANEGFASLFEQCNISDDKLTGLVNWRLPIVQKAITDGTLPTLRTMMTQGDRAFRASGGGGYAAARYFMQYLQEKGKLVAFYRAFRDGFDKDKTGVTFAEELLGQKLEDVETDWRKWVMTLHR